MSVPSPCAAPHLACKLGCSSSPRMFSVSALALHSPTPMLPAPWLQAGIQQLGGDATLLFYQSDEGREVSRVPGIQLLA